MIEKEYKLPLNPDYVSGWGFWQACRELLQNAIDQCAEDWQSSIVFEYDVHTQRLRIGATKCRIAPKTLLLGMSTKRGNEQRIGEHGEGYKLAMLVLLRNFFGVTVLNGDQRWTPMLEHDDDYDESILKVYVSHANGDSFDGVVFVIDGVTQEHYAEVCANYLPDHKGNRILEADYLRGRIFMGGLFVCEIKGISHGYDFAPNRLKLDRDRQMLDSYDVMHETGKMWAEIGCAKRLYSEVVEKKSPDSEYAPYYVNSDMAEQIADLYVKNNPGAVPVANDSEAQVYRGGDVRIVNSQLSSLIRRFKKFVAFRPEGSPSQQLEEFATRWRRCLPGEGQKDLQGILDASTQWTC